MVCKTSKEVYEVERGLLEEGEGLLDGGDPVSLKNFRMAAWAVAAWHVMFENVKVLAGGSLELFVASGKTYGKDDPRTGVVAPRGRDDCPVEFLLSYMEFIRVVYPEKGDKFLFPSLFGKNIPLSKTMLYQSALRQLRKVTTELNIPLEDLKRFGLHSCRVVQLLLHQMQVFLYLLFRRRAGGLQSPPPRSTSSPARRFVDWSLGLYLACLVPLEFNSLSLCLIFNFEFSCDPHFI